MDLRVARPHALVAFASFFAPLFAWGVAHAEVIDLPDTRAELVLDLRTWHAVTKPGLVAGYATDRGERLAITRAQIPNPDAWRAKTRDAYIDQIESGIVAAGYKRTSKKVTTIEGVPVLDLEATHRRGRIVIRVILFRTYALSLAIEGVSSRTAARAIARTFVPPPARPEGSP
jgi:hypothetical protein